MDKIPDIFSLQQERKSRDKIKQDIYTIVLNKCIEKIVYTNRHTDKSFVIFEVPKILIGYPSYDMKHCLLFLIEKLSQQQYLVEFLEPFYLYIDWGRNQSSSTSSMNPDKLKQKTKKLLEKFPNASKIEFVYEDTFSSKNKSKKNK